MIFAFNNIGSETKKDKLGITNQKISLERLDILFKSLVSKYNQKIAITLISGIDANIEAINELRFDISEINAINPAERKILSK